MRKIFFCIYCFLFIIYRISDNVAVPNWFKKSYYDVRKLRFHFSKESMQIYLQKFIAWIEKGDFEVIEGGEYSLQSVVRILQAILKKKWHPDEAYMFTAKKDIEFFIANQLGLDDKDKKAAWLIKAVFISYKEYIRSKMYKENPHIFDYFYTVMFHAWFFKDKIKPHKCLLIKVR